MKPIDGMTLGNLRQNNLREGSIEWLEQLNRDFENAATRHKLLKILFRFGVTGWMPEEHERTLRNYYGNNATQ